MTNTEELVGAIRAVLKIYREQILDPVHTGAFWFRAVDEMLDVIEAQVDFWESMSKEVSALRNLNERQHPVQIALHQTAAIQLQRIHAQLTQGRTET